MPMSDPQGPSTQLAPTAYQLVDAFSDPTLFDGVLWRRVAAYLIDITVLVAVLLLYKIAVGLLVVVTFGLLAPLLILIGAAIPAAYHTLTVGGARSATLGMRACGLEVRIWNGGKPGYLQALLHAAAFYVTVGFTGGLILLWPLFSNRSRCLHDLVCGTVVVRRPSQA